MVQYSKLKKGHILGEASYFTVLEDPKRQTLPNGEVIEEVKVADANGNVGEINRKYIETIMNSADQFTSTEKMSRTDIIKKLEENPRISCSIYFRKKDTDKKVKAFKTEKESKIEGITTLAEKVAKSPIADIPTIIKQIETEAKDLIENPLSKVIPGEMRLIKGYHHNTRDAAGRLQFTDMEATPVMVKGVDTRTIEFIIVGDVKYEVK